MNKRMNLVLILTIVASSTLISCGEEQDSSRPSYENENRIGNYIDSDNYRNYYHIFVPTYADSNNDGIGDLKGIIDKIDYLRMKDKPHAKGSLGVNGIFLSPINKGTSYHKYDIENYTSTDPQFGTLETFDTLIKACHERGIKVIMDLVLNHSSNLNPLFIKARRAVIDDVGDESGRPTSECVTSCPEVDYFRFIRSNKGFNDYSNRTFLLNSEWKYEGFDSTMPDWNLDSPAVRNLHSSYIKFWLDRGVDGFRLDAVQSYYGEVNISLNKNYEYINFINSEVKKIKSDAYIIAEGPWSISGASSYMQNTNIDSYFNFDYSYMNYASSNNIFFNSLRNDNMSLSTLKTFFEYEGKESEINSTHIDANFASNHDIGRANNQFILKSKCYLNELKFYYGLMNMLKGNYFNYYGDEIGLTGTKVDSDDMPCRSPFRWGDNYDTSPLESGLNEKTIQYLDPLDKQIEDKNSLFNYMASIYKIKDYHPEIQRGNSTIVKEIKDKNLVLIKKTYEKSSKYLLINYGIDLKESSYNELEINGKIENCLSSNGEYSEVKDGVISIPSMSITIINER